jgi:hypothetical protein
MSCKLFGKLELESLEGSKLTLGVFKFVAGVLGISEVIWKIILKKILFYYFIILLVFKMESLRQFFPSNGSVLFKSSFI